MSNAHRVAQSQSRFQKYEPPEDESWVEYNRDHVEREANSDARDAWVFERLLQSLEAES